MLRVKDLPKEQVPGKQEVADFFGLTPSNVFVEAQQDTFSINIKENHDAQEIFKKIAPFGNAKRPGAYNFNDNILIIWKNNKVQPA